MFTTIYRNPFDLAKREALTTPDQEEAYTNQHTSAQRQEQLVVYPICQVYLTVSQI